jgi:hypothetical protein
MIRRIFPALLVAVVLALPLTLSAADGSLKIKFKFDGKAPTPAKLKIDKDVEFCGPKMLTDESVKVGADGGLQNVVMFMYVAPGKKAPESAAATAALAKEVKVDNMGCRYEPRITLLHTSQSLVIGNPDPIGHNSKGDLFANPSFNDLIPAGGSVTKKFPKTERGPMPLACNIHPWMSGFLLIRDNPFFGVSNDKGELTIKNVPEGKHTFVIWQEKAGFVTKGVQGGKTSEWKTGRIEVTVKGDTDLGEFTVSPEVLKLAK